MSARVFLIAIALVATSAAPSEAVPFVGLTASGTGDRLFFFDSATPGTTTSTLTVTGLPPGDHVERIDTRPATGELYGTSFQNNTLGNPLNLYTINTVTGAATLVATTSLPVQGGVPGIAFDPVTDKLRIVAQSSANAPAMNLLVNPVTGATVIEGSLVYTAGDRNAGATPAVGNIGYTNQDQSPAPETQLYGLDLVRSVLFKVDDPILGTISTIGPLDIQTASFAGFDIVGSTTAFMSTGILPGVTGFYNVDLGTGAATLIGTNINQIVDIAEVQTGPVQPVPEPTSMSLLGLSLSLAGLLAMRRWL